MKYLTAISLFCLTLLLSAHNVAAAQEQFNWDGAWLADGTLFKIRVAVAGNEIEVTSIESLGFEWTASKGKVTGNTATVEVAYAGVTGVIAIELLSDASAVAHAQSCIPEFMVVCALAKNQQALFVRDD